VRVGIAKLKVDAAALKELSGIGNHLRVVAVKRHEFVTVHPAVLGVTLFAFGQFGEEAVVVDGAEKAVGVEVALGAECEGMPHDQFAFFLGKGRSGKANEVARVDADEFVGSEGNLMINHFEGIDHGGVFEGRRLRGNIFSRVEKLREVSVDLTEAFVVFGQGDEERLSSISKVDSRNGFHSFLVGHAHKVDGARGGVDVGDGD